MAAYITRRVAWTSFVCFGITIFVFVISHIIPANPARAAAGLDATEDQVAIIGKEMGLDRPLPEQYLLYMKGLLRGDLGVSIRDRRPVADDIRTFFPASFELTLAGMVLVIGLGIPLGVAAALARGTFLDFSVRALSLGGAGMPSFWLALLLQLLFFRQLGWLPSGARLDPLAVPPPTVTGMYTVDAALAGQWATFGNALYHLILPAVAVALGRIALVLRVTRRSVLGVLGQDYVRTARAKGLPVAAVTRRHVIRNALIPIITIVSLQIGWLLAGTVFIEFIFSWPGLGAYALASITYFDFTAMMGVTLVISLVFVIINLVVDVLYTLVDPRIQY